MSNPNDRTGIAKAGSRRAARLISASVAALAAVFGPAAAAAQTGPVRLTPEQAVALALDASFRVDEGEARVDAASAAAGSRRAARQPVVALLGGYTRTNHVDEYGITMPGQPPRIIYPDVPDNWRARVDVQWPVYTGGRLPALERAAATERDASSQDVRTVRSDTRLDAQRAFWTLHMAVEARRVVGESLKRIDAHLKDVQAMKNAGLVAPSDVLLTQARRSKEQLLLIEAGNAVAASEADLKRVTGLPASAQVTLEVPDDTGPALPSDETALVAEARRARPERQALELRLQALSERRTAALAGGRPTVALTGGADYARPNPRIFPRAAEWNPSFDLGVSVAWNAWDGGRAKADAAETDALRRAAAARLAEFDRQLAFDVTQRALDLASSRAAVDAARDGERAATEAHRVIAERFKAGLVSSTDVLDAQVALDQAQMDVTRAKTSVRLAQARLERVLGR